MSKPKGSVLIKSLRPLSVLCGSAVNIFKGYHRRDAENAEINAEKKLKLVHYPARVGAVAI
jgi:hypothetical protein